MQNDLTLIEGLLRDHFVIEGKLFSTPLADAHKAVDRYTHSAVMLWLLKFPLDLRSNEAKVFSTRLQSLQSISSGAVTILSFGIDSAGTGFVAIPPLNGFPLYTPQLDRVEGERRFAACVDLISHLHERGIVCGDISPQSFWIGRNGQVSFIGVVGMLDCWFNKMDPSMLATVERFIAPEIKEGQPPSLISDVFSLGVLGYLMLTNAYPIDEESEARGVHALRPLKRVMEDPPEWGDKILLRALEYDDNLRFASAVELRDAILQAKKEEFLSSMTPIKYGSDLMERDKSIEKRDSVLITGPVMRPSRSSDESQADDLEDVGAKQTGKRGLIAGLGALLLALLGIMTWVLFFRVPTDLAQVAPGETVDGLTEAAQNLQVRQAIAMIGGDEAQISSDEKYFDDLAVSADPLAGDVLVRNAVEPRSNAVRVFAERAVLKRTERLGFVRAAKELKSWLDALPTGIPPASYEIMLRVVDPTLPQAAREELLKKLFALDGKAAAVLTAALALDSVDMQSYQPVFRDMIKAAHARDVDESLSMQGLILMEPETSTLFGEEIIEKIQDYDLQEIFSVLGALIELKDPRMQAIRDEILRRAVLAPPRDFFLSMISSQGDISTASLKALMHAANGTLQEADLRGLGTWISKDAEKVLICLCADTVDPALRLAVFDLLAGRSITNGSVSMLLEWIREKQWETRGNFVVMTGLLACADKLPQDKVKEIYALIDAHAAVEGFISALIDTGSTNALRYIFARHSSKVPVNQAFNLLLHEDKEIRISAMKLLGELNDLTAMKLIIDRYEDEKDPDVRNAYKNTFWFIKQRN